MKKYLALLFVIATGVSAEPFRSGMIWNIGKGKVF
jgi:hypothetical protein